MTTPVEANANRLANLHVNIASGDALDVRQFTVHERMSSLFVVSLLVMGENPSVDFDAAVGRPARFSIQSGPYQRSWSGLCNRLQQVAVEERGLSTYQVDIVPALWLTTQRRNHRIFQQRSELEIVLELLGEWSIYPEKRLTSVYKTRKYRVQYGESDFAFMSRMLEDAGVAFYFEEHGEETKLVLADAPQGREPRAHKIPFRDNPTPSEREHVTAVRIGQQVRPGRYTVQDHDYRHPADYKLLTSAEANGDGIEQRLEQFHYTPGAFLFGTEKGESTPHADDRGRTRTDEIEGKALAERRLAAERATARVCTFTTNALDLAPGVVMRMVDHPHAELGEGKSLLVVESTMSGTLQDMKHACEVRSAALPYRPELSTPKPKVSGVESATVVGPKGEEIHTDEFGRVRVHFHWDRESQMDEKSSCWIHVSQPWGGAGYGGTSLPRVGQEVLVDFLGGDPDRPVIVGRVYTNLQKTPYKLPDNKTQSGWRSNSTGGGGGGGYNEMMFEDAAGKELVRMQAEKDLQKLVKNDEQVNIGHDRMKAVGHDDRHQVGHNRTRTVGKDESVQIGNDEKRSVTNDRTRQVGNDETIAIGSNRTKTIGSNEEMTIGANQSLVVGSNQTAQVGGDRNEQVGGNANLSVDKVMTLHVALTKSETVGITASETIGVTKKLDVGQSYEVAGGQSMQVQVGQTHSVTVGDVWQLNVGASTIHVDKAGNVTITAQNVAILSSGPVLVEADGAVKVQAGGSIKIQGSTVDLN
jgi:type VI secretion system secreted protein VgrG